MFSKSQLLSKSILAAAALTLIPAQLSAKEKLQVVGSSTIMPIAKEASKAFAKKTKKIVIVKGGGSSFGVKHALADKGLGMASRSLKGKETAKGAVGSVIGQDGIALAVNVDNKVKNLTKEQITKIFAGEITNWKEVGGHDGAIELLGPNKDHGTHGAFVSIMKLKGKLAKSFKGFKAHRQTMFNVQKKKNAIGWMPLGNFQQFVVHKKQFKANAIVVDGVEPVVANVTNGTYPIVRPLNLVTKGQPTGLAKEFIDFILSPEGQELIAKHDFVPVGK